MNIDAIKEEAFYYPISSNMKPYYELSIDNQETQSSGSKFYNPRRKTKRYSNWILWTDYERRKEHKQWII